MLLNGKKYIYFADSPSSSIFNYLKIDLFDKTFSLLSEYLVIAKQTYIGKQMGKCGIITEF